MLIISLKSEIIIYTLIHFSIYLLNFLFKEEDGVFLNFLLENFSGHMTRRKVISVFSKKNHGVPVIRISFVFCRLWVVITEIYFSYINIAFRKHTML